MNIKPKKILVTGGAGFIGSHVIPNLLSGGHSVRVLDNLSVQVHGPLPQNLNWLDHPNLEFIRGSVLDPAMIKNSLVGIDTVIHLASETGTGQSMYDIRKYVDVNDVGTASILDEIVNNQSNTVTRFILTSSRSVYGEGAYECPTCNTRVYPKPRAASDLKNRVWEPLCNECYSTLRMTATTENDETKPSSIYAATKLAQEYYTKITCESLGIDYAILRLQNVYGEGQSLTNPYTGILSIFSNKIRQGLQLPIFEDGNESRDFVHVSDVASAIFASVVSTEPINQTINVGSGVATSIYQVAEFLSEAFDESPEIVITSQFRLGDIRHNCADITKLSAFLGVTPTVSLFDGLKSFANWVSSQPVYPDQVERANKELKDRKLLG